MVSCAFFIFCLLSTFILTAFFLCRLRGRRRRWRAPTESSAGDDQVSRPLIPVLVSFLIYFLISFLFRVIRDPILLILASEGSRGIFGGPAARACGIDGWGWPGVTRYDDPSCLFSFVFYFIFKNFPFFVFRPILLLTPFLVFDRLGNTSVSSPVTVLLRYLWRAAGRGRASTGSFGF